MLSHSPEFACCLPAKFPIVKIQHKKIPNIVGSKNKSYRNRIACKQATSDRSSMTTTNSANSILSLQNTRPIPQSGIGGTKKSTVSGKSSAVKIFDKFIQTLGEQFASFNFHTISEDILTQKELFQKFATYLFDDEAEWEEVVYAGEGINNVPHYVQINEVALSSTQLRCNTALQYLSGVFMEIQKRYPGNKDFKNLAMYNGNHLWYTKVSFSYEERKRKCS
jgi:hypothetical protein